jgi:hypothetical protein
VGTGIGWFVFCFLRLPHGHELCLAVGFGLRIEARRLGQEGEEETTEEETRGQDARGTRGQDALATEEEEEEEATEEAAGKIPATRAGETPTPQQKKPLRRS